MKLSRTHNALVTAAIEAILEGDWDVGARVERVGKIIAQSPHLSAGEKKSIIKQLKYKLAITLRAKRGLIVSAQPLAQEVQNTLVQHAHSHGALIIENQIDPQLISGFQFQLGDDRWDSSLKNRLNQFIQS